MSLMSSMELLLLVFSIMGIFLKSASGISCYQCVSTDHTNPFQCNEYLEEVDLKPEPCDAVYDAQFCVKHTGRFEAWGFDCYQCTSASTIDCADNLIHESGADILLHSCDHVFEARYCIKTVGLYGGGLGTKRFCSSLDLGNYCNYIQQPGDELEYRSCVYTCSSEGCNPANTVTAPTVLISTIISATAFLYGHSRCHG